MLRADSFRLLSELPLGRQNQLRVMGKRYRRRSATFQSTYGISLTFSSTAVPLVFRGHSARQERSDDRRQLSGSQQDS
jgi:hypothetical protein